MSYYASDSNYRDRDRDRDRDPDIFYPEPRKSLNRADMLSWATVRTGLAQIVFGCVPLALGLVIFAIMTMSQRGMGGPFGRGGFDAGDGMYVEFMMIVFSFSIIAGIALFLTGALTCCAAPYNYGVRGWAIAALFSMIAFLLVAIMSYVLVRMELQNINNQMRFQPQMDARGRFIAAPPPPRPSSASEFLMKASPYLMKATFLLYVVFLLLFMRSTSIATGKNQAHIHVMVYLAVFVALFVILNLLSFAGKLDFLDAPQFATFVMVGLAGMFSWFAIMTGQVRGTVSRMLLEE